MRADGGSHWPGEDLNPRQKHASLSIPLTLALFIHCPNGDRTQQAVTHMALSTDPV